MDWTLEEMDAKLLAALEPIPHQKENHTDDLGQCDLEKRTVETLAEHEVSSSEPSSSNTSLQHTEDQIDDNYLENHPEDCMVIDSIIGVQYAPLELKKNM